MEHVDLSRDGHEGKVPSGKEPYLTFDDRPIIAALVNAVKELKAENDVLKARLDALESK